MDEAGAPAPAAPSMAPSTSAPPLRGGAAQFSRQVRTLAERRTAGPATASGGGGGKLRRRGRVAAARGTRAVKNPFSRTNEIRLRSAVSEQDYATVQDLLEAGVNPMAADDKKRAPIHFAVTKGDHAILQLLLDHEADPNQRDFKDNTPLHLAACTQHLSTVTMLLDSGADFSARDAVGRTPLHYAESHLRLILRLRRDSDPAEVLRGKVAAVADMLGAYLRRAAIESADELADISDQLAHAGTANEVGDVAELLRTFTELTLQQQEAAHNVTD
eukprot:CAMPEP_0182933386 /NCGR_PEP_ID=MMETSP0105_2-20130417/33730_1 /TAXON_ID=81532 ORGANISM="Acanthoeca-like sp., Strain 10tr" /NCGR_SAMPLE_ID=MMETSP0105_2 /ASSEMBLY_ACC=CAM_ASM_000205 /LENGTH=273 /DNA_ID=CAMNT_0025072105 /DNA_START=26 /DNA_END=847 /DNA_ORIENTATION=-